MEHSRNAQGVSTFQCLSAMATCKLRLRSSCSQRRSQAREKAAMDAFLSSPHLHMLKHELTFKYQTKKKKKNPNHLCLGTIEKSFPRPIRNSNRVKQIHEQKKPNHKPEKSTGTASDTVKPSLGEAAMGIFSCWQSKDSGSFPRL